MKRFLAILGLLVIVASLPAAATAGRAIRFSDHSVSTSCDGLDATSGGGFAFLGASVSDAFGPDAFIDFWASGDTSTPPDLFRDFDQPAEVTWDGSVLAGSVPLLDGNGEPAGSASFSATLVPSGDPFTFDDRFRDGNTRQDFSGVSQPMDVSGSLVVGGSTFSLDGCFGDETTITVFATAPHSFVTHFSQRGVDCALSNAAGDTGFLFASFFDGDVFIDSGGFPADGSAGIGAFGGGTLSGEIFDSTLDTYSFDTGEPAAATASIHLEIVGTGDPVNYLVREATVRLSVRGDSLDIEGTLSIGDMTFDLGPCVGVDADAKLIVTSPNGPKPGGKVPSNDLPSGAKLLGVGDRTSVSTKGASPDREAPFECLTFGFDGDSFEIPVGHTVWYRVVGTGGAVTVDTAGSDYDTVAAVYTSDGTGSYTPVPGACVDDVALDPVGRSLQSAVTWDTVAGTSYYVQIGGFPEAVTYGNLRVAVR